MNFKKKYIGDRAFYKMLFALVLPLIIQQGLTNFASLADNLMVGALGTTPMSSVWAKPTIVPLPRHQRTMAAMAVVMFESRMAVNAL